MRTIEYLKKLDSYKIESDSLRLTRVEIDLPNCETDASQSERLRMLVQSKPETNPALKNFEFERDGLSFFTGTVFDEEYAMDLREVNVKTCSLELGFILSGEHKERDFFKVKIPFEGSNGSLFFATTPIFGKIENYEITWKNGFLSSVSERIGGQNRVFRNIGSVHGAAGAKLSTFEVKETL